MGVHLGLCSERYGFLDLVRRGWTADLASGSKPNERMHAIYRQLPSYLGVGNCFLIYASLQSPKGFVLKRKEKNTLALIVTLVRLGTWA